MQRPSFLNQEAPAGYIAGVGRGATGFSTRGESTNKGRTPKRYQERNDGSTANYTSSTAIEVNSVEPADNNAKEAEEVFAAIETKLSSRRKAAKDTNEGATQSIPKQFADLKRSLATVTEEEWLSLPDAGDITKKHKRERLQDQMNRKEYAAPDTLIHGGVNLSKLTEEREKLLVRQLDVSFVGNPNANGTMPSTDATVYLNDLENLTVNHVQNADHSEDIKKMRTVLQSYRKADPLRPEGWIASARLEEKCHRYLAAKNIIEEGCLQCPRDDQVWLERIRLHETDVKLCKILVADGIKFNPRSLPLWLKAAELESEPFNKLRVAMKALQELPTSEELWKLVLRLESDKIEAKRMLLKAVELVPRSVDLWRALIELQEYEEAKKSLNRARKFLPGEFKLWILAAQVEEKFNKQVTCERLVKLLKHAIVNLKDNGTEPDLMTWLKQAQWLDTRGDSPKASIAIVQAALEEKEIESNESHILTIVNSMDDSMTKIVAYRTLLQANPINYSIWKSLRTTCERASKIHDLYSTFESILYDQDASYKTLKKSPTLALMYAKEVWKYGQNTAKALEILNKSIEIEPLYLDFWIAKLKVLCLSSQFSSAKEVFIKALESLSGTEVPHLERLHYKYVDFLRFQDEHQEAVTFLESTCLSKFPDCYKFYIQKGQIYQHLGQLDKMRETYSMGTKILPHCSILWVLLARTDEIQLNKPTRARSDLDIALLKNPTDELLYLAKIQMEVRLGNHDQAKLIILEALKKFPRSPNIWSENIKLISSTRASMKKTMFQDALRNTDNSCEVLMEIGLTFYKESQLETASKWFERATKKNPKNGDAWVWLTRCSKMQKKDLTAYFEKVTENEPVYGKLWISVSKSIATQYSRPSQILDILVNNEQV